MKEPSVTDRRFHSTQGASSDPQPDGHDKFWNGGTFCVDRDGSTREELLSRLRDPSDEKSWADFYYMYWSLIFGTAMRFGLDTFEAEEILQDTFVSFVQHLSRYDPDKGSFEGWLVRQAKWKVVNHLKRKREYLSIDLVGDALSCDQFTNHFNEQWKETLVKLALERLKNSASPHLVEVFSMCVLRRQGIKQTAIDLQITTPAVHMALYKFKRLLRQEIELLKAEGV